MKKFVLFLSVLLLAPSVFAKNSDSEIIRQLPSGEIRGRTVEITGGGYIIVDGHPTWYIRGDEILRFPAACDRDLGGDGVGARFLEPATTNDGVGARF